MKWKEYIRIAILKNYLINRFVLYFRRVIFFLDYLRMRKNSKREIWDIKELSYSLKNTSLEWCLDTAHFGIGETLKKYIDKKHLKRYYLEHGLFLGDFIHKDAFYVNTDIFLVQSEFRKKVMFEKIKNKKYFDIGSYIHYAKDYYSNQKIFQLKEQYKKTLLVFPLHSTSEVEYEYDKKEFISEILKLKEQYKFETIMVCLFYEDIQRGEEVEYKTNNFLVVTAGHRYDYYFLSRLKSIIKLSDVTISNAVGGQVGYCLALKKPHYIFEQKIKVNGRKTLKDFEEWNSTHDKKEWENFLNDERKIYEAFSEYTEKITAFQFTVGDYYFGIKNKKTKEEIKNILGG